MFVQVAGWAKSMREEPPDYSRLLIIEDTYQIVVLDPATGVVYVYSERAWHRIIPEASQSRNQQDRGLYLSEYRQPLAVSVPTHECTYCGRVYENPTLGEILSCPSDDCPSHEKA